MLPIQLVDVDSKNLHLVLFYIYFVLPIVGNGNEVDNVTFITFTTIIQKINIAIAKTVDWTAFSAQDIDDLKLSLAILCDQQYTPLDVSDFNRFVEKKEKKKIPQDCFKIL